MYVEGLVFLFLELKVGFEWMFLLLDKLDCELLFVIYFWEVFLFVLWVFNWKLVLMFLFFLMGENFEIIGLLDCFLCWDFWGMICGEDFGVVMGVDLCFLLLGLVDLLVVCFWVFCLVCILV